MIARSLVPLERFAFSTPFTAAEALAEALAGRRTLEDVAGVPVCIDVDTSGAQPRITLHFRDRRGLHHLVLDVALRHSPAGPTRGGRSSGPMA